MPPPLFVDSEGYAISLFSTGIWADDWHLPAIGELRTILIGGEAAPGQALTCSAAPCIDPDFAALGGPTWPSFYWSASTGAGNPLDAWGTFLSTGTVFASGKTNAAFVRAVRAGACNRA